MVAVPEDVLPQGQRECGLITVTNVGRRPVFISHVCLRMPNYYEENRLLLKESIQGRKLSEDDPPANFVVPYDGLDKYSEGWEQIHAEVTDSTGLTYVSKRRKMEKPKWIKKSLL